MQVKDKHLENLCEKYSFKVKKFSDLIYITSKVDEWFLKFENEKYSILYHKNTKHDYNGYHRQKMKFRNILGTPNIEHVFKCIKNHDEYVLCKKGTNNIMEILNQHKQSLKFNL